MKYDIFLTVLNSKYVHSSLAPWCLFSAIKKKLPHINAKVFESTINADIDENLKHLLSFDCSVYGFCCYIWNIKETLTLAEKIKKERPDAIILLGGPEVSYRAESILFEEWFVDFIISGEGEEPICGFLSQFPDNITSVKGLFGKNIKGEPFVSDKEYPSPYRKEYFENLNGKIAYIESSRGCPYSCAFCLSGRCSPVRYFPLERIYSEIIMLANAGTKTIKFVDRTFNANAKRANEILKFILENSGEKFPRDVCFHFEIAGDILKDDTLDILKNAPCGLIQLEIGLQTFNEETLCRINRKTNIKKLTENIKKLISYNNMHIHIDLIAGLPLENYESFKETFNKAYELNADMLQLGFLKLLHGSPMRELPEKYPCEFSKEAPYEVISTPYISREELLSVKICEESLERLYNSNRFIKTLEFVLKKGDTKPYDFFYNFGKYTEATGKGASLDTYTELFYKFLTENMAFDKDIIRDLLCIDRLSSNKSGKMPNFLKKDDEIYGKIKKYYAQKGINMSLVILYTQNKIAFADYKSEKQKNGTFKLIYKDKDNLLYEIENA